MHELSIAMNILDILQDTCRTQNYGRVNTVFVRIGRASGIQADALHFAFEHARAGTIAADARLQIEEISVGGHCDDCGAEFTVEEKYVFECPRCGGSRFRITSGHELEILELEVNPE